MYQIDRDSREGINENREDLCPLKIEKKEQKCANHSRKVVNYVQCQKCSEFFIFLALDH